MNIRSATLKDAPALVKIYAPYVEQTAVTFEYDVPDEAEILGYAYASSFHSRAAYGWSAETSIYVKMGLQHKGVGTALYQELEKYLKQQNVCNLCACIAFPNPPSIAFHERFGYQTVAHFHASGYKLGAWHDMVWMEKELCPHTVPPKPFIPFPHLKTPAF